MVALSDVQSDNPTLRVDSGYFGKAALEVEQQVKGLPHAPIGDLSVSVLSFGAYALTNQVQYQDEGIPFLRCADIKDGFVSLADTLHVNEAAHTLLYKSRVSPETVLLTMSGTVGETAVALPEWTYPINSNQDIAKIRTSGLNPYYLAAFLGSHHGRAQVDRLPVGSVQQHIFLSMIERLLVARLGQGLEERIGTLARRAYLGREEVSSVLAQAELDLLDLLHLHDWSPSEPLTYTRSAAAVAEAGRMDAAYFAPKYDEIAQRLRATGHSLALGDEATAFICRGTQPDYGEGDMPVVNSKHVRTNRVLLDSGNRLASGGRVRIRYGDVLINGTGVGTIGRAAPYLHGQEAVPDNHVTIVRLDGIDPIFLSVFLNSSIGQQQIERMISGSSGQVELYPADIRRILIWRAPEDVQRRVAARVRAAFSLEAESTRLLAAAKRAVEIAIEDGEGTALAYIAEQEDGDADPA